MGIKSGFVTNLDRYKLGEAVGVVVAVVFGTSQWGGEGGCGVFLHSVYSSAYLIGVELCFFL